jgi:hypothetical protein
MLFWAIAVFEGMHRSPLLWVACHATMWDVQHHHLQRLDHLVLCSKSNPFPPYYNTIKEAQANSS